MKLLIPRDLTSMQARTILRVLDMLIDMLIESHMEICRLYDIYPCADDELPF